MATLGQGQDSVEAAPDAPAVGGSAVELAAATIVREGLPESLEGEALRPSGLGRDALFAALGGGPPIWLDMNPLDRPKRWVDPWTVPSELRVDWRCEHER